MLRAIIVDDEALSVKLLKNLLSESNVIEISQTFLSSLEAYEYVKANPVDVAFLDISMPGINGMGLSILLHNLDPSIDVVFVTAYDDYAVRAFDLSALDYIMKPVDPQRLSKTLCKIRNKHRNEAGGAGYWRGPTAPEGEVSLAAGGPDLENSLLRLISSGLAKLGMSNENKKSFSKAGLRDDALVEPLTSRETDILYALSNGLSNKEIADRFGITEATVKSHVFRIYGKLGVKRRVQAIAMARDLKFIE
ncbi:response regulator transcription factor [Paenibacillus cremeus]|uniref:Response regulator transcription factor n=1 Tax=Paenibacillus cremeus TaxID=2163881 RepID=A0A559JCH7_9BACL|nr:response regulator transcription factor [Paenibacillus cremeus]TVX97573.1 response regulator transcription factor [Paenibacillus cremeus]